MIVELAGDDFVGGLSDEIGFFFGEFAEIAIDESGGFFQDAEGADQLGRHGVFADGEVDEGAGGLRTVVAVHRNFDFAHAVGFGARGNGFGELRGFGHGVLLRSDEDSLGQEV